MRFINKAFQLTPNENTMNMRTRSHDKDNNKMRNNKKVPVKVPVVVVEKDSPNVIAARTERMRNYDPMKELNRGQMKCCAFVTIAMETAFSCS